MNYSCFFTYNIRLLLHMFWHLENQLLFVCNYVSEIVKHTVMGFKEYSGQNTEDSTALQY